MKKRWIIAPDGEKITLSDFDEMDALAQENWCETHGIPLAYFGHLSRYAKGIPATYAYIQEFLG